MKQKIVLIFILAALLFANAAQADLVTCGGPGVAGGPPEKACGLKDLVLVVIKLINTLLGLSWIVATFFVFWGGWGMVTSSGNEENLKGAKTTFRNAVIGFFIILIAVILTNFLVVAYTSSEYDLNSIRDFLP